MYWLLKQMTHTFVTYYYKKLSCLLWVLPTALLLWMYWGVSRQGPEKSLLWFRWIENRTDYRGPSKVRRYIIIGPILMSTRGNGIELRIINSMIDKYNHYVSSSLPLDGQEPHTKSLPRKHYYYSPQSIYLIPIKCRSHYYYAALSYTYLTCHMRRLGAERPI